MNTYNQDQSSENQWLEEILQEVEKQFNSNKDFKNKINKDIRQTNKDLWDNLGAISSNNGIDQIVDFMQYISFIKSRKITEQSTNKLHLKYIKMLNSPYFGRIDFKEDDSLNSEMYYIGLYNLINDNIDFLIYDWRAPISSIFYDSEIGPTKYICPEGIINGQLTLKRQYKIVDGKLNYMFDSNIKIDDEILQSILSSTTDNKMKTIVTSIQKEQNKIIRNEDHRNLIVQGPAGSGKTSIALHRIAYLLYAHRETIKPENIVIFSPNDVFNDYISNVLPQLGEDNMYQTTFKEYMSSAIGNSFKKGTYIEMMEFILNRSKDLSYDTRILNMKYKSSFEFINIVKHYLSQIENTLPDFEDIVFRDTLIISKNELISLFKDNTVKLAFKNKLTKIKNRILFLLEPIKKSRINEVMDELSKKEVYVNNNELVRDSILVVNEELQPIHTHINQLLSINMINIYRNLFKNLATYYNDLGILYDSVELNDIIKYTLENLNMNTLYYEDQIIFLYMKIFLGEIQKTTEIKYLVIDEAQDYMPLQYEIFYNLFPSAKMTILGDLNQSINPFLNLGDYDNLYNVFPKDKSHMVTLTTSYRSTKEIIDFSKTILKSDHENNSVERHGDEPAIIKFLNNEEINNKIIEDIKSYKEKSYKSIGIITKTLKEAKVLYNSLKDKIPVTSIFKDDDFYVNDTIIIPSYLAKGLEFDVVLVYNGGKDNYSCEEDRLLFYTICTRALHVLNIYYSGEISPFILK